jgi:hypothetical protein
MDGKYGFDTEAYMLTTSMLSISSAEMALLLSTVATRFM